MSRTWIELGSVLLAFIAFVGCHTFVAAQVAPKETWVRINDEKLSLAMPSNYQVMSNPRGFDRFPTTLEPNGKSPPRRLMSFRNIRYITASNGSSSFWLIKYETDGGTPALDSMLPPYSNVDEVVRVAFGEFAGYSFYKATDQFYSQELLLLSGKSLYHILAASKNKSDNSLQYFLSGLRLGGKAPFNLPSVLHGIVDERQVVMANLADTAFQIEKQPNSAPVVTAKSDTLEPTVVIIAKPLARYTDEALQMGASGRVKLRVTFGDDGTIKSITVIKGLKYGLTDRAVQAARLIRFLPAGLGGKRVDKELVVEYEFRSPSLLGKNIGR